MSLPTQAKCVVIGAGIVGNSMVYHLARLGWRVEVAWPEAPKVVVIVYPPTSNWDFFLGYLDGLFQYCGICQLYFGNRIARPG